MESVTLKSSAETVVTNPVSLSAAEGQIAVAWMHVSAPDKAETVVELQFVISGKKASSLTFAEVNLFNKGGQRVAASIYNGEVGVSAKLQKPVLEDVGSATPRLSGKLFDATYCEGNHVSAVQAIIAYYYNGRMVDVLIPSEPVLFDENGVASFRYDLDDNKDANLIKLFFVDADGGFAPMCESCEFDMR